MTFLVAGSQVLPFRAHQRINRAYFHHWQPGAKPQKACRHACEIILHV